MALATPYQLWRLNQLGQLAITPGSTPLDHHQADAAIKATGWTPEPKPSAPNHPEPDLEQHA